MFNWFKPSRSAALPRGGQLVSDLDKMISDPIAFKWGGRIHTIKPVTTEQFLKVSEAMLTINQLVQKNTLSVEEIIDAYWRVFSAVCDSITKKDVARMTQAQLGALYQIIVETVTGKAHASGEKKTPQ